MSDWGFQSPAAAGWAATGLVLVLLYLFRPRFRPQPVAASFLWSQVSSQLGGQSFWRRLQRHRLLWLQLLFALLIVLALMRPYQVQPGLVGSQVVLLLDSSASMTAGQPARPSRFEQSRQEARRIVRQAPSGTRFLLATLDSELRLLQSFSEDRGLLVAQLEAVQPRALAGRDALAAPFLNSLWRNHPEAEVHWFSDHPLKGLAQVYHPARQGQVNYSIDSFQVTSERIFLALGSDDVAPAQLSFEVRGPQGYQIQRSCSLKGKGRQLLQFPWSGGEGEFTVELLSGDDFGLDNRAFCRLSPRPPGRIWLHDDLQSPLLQALMAASGEAVVRAPLQSGQEQGLHLWARLPEAPDSRRQVALAPPRSWVAGTVEDEGPLLLAPDQKSRFPMNLRSLRWGPRVRLKPGLAGCKPLLITPSGEPLLVERDQSLVWLFPLECSELPLSPELPVLMSSWLRGGRDQQHRLEGSLLCGQRLRLPPGGAAEVRGPHGTERLEQSHWTPTWPGWYQWGERRLAVNYHAPDEFRASLLHHEAPTAAASGPPEASGPPKARLPMTRDWSGFLALLGLGVLLVELRLWWGR